jgi:alpha-tubulin suppressor-like RCC1 family protein
VYDQLPAGGAIDLGRATTADGPARIVKVDVGPDNVCVVTEEAEVRCWGNNDQGQLGYGFVGGRAGFADTPAQFYQTIGRTNVRVF